MNQQFQDFYTHLNEAVDHQRLCRRPPLSQTKKANQFTQCGLNPVYRAYLSVDLDYIGADRKFQEPKVPAPSIATTNRANEHAHYFYRLITPVAYQKSGQGKPQDFFEEAGDDITIQLKAGLDFNQTLTKNPLHNRWIVESSPASYHKSDFQ